MCFLSGRSIYIYIRSTSATWTTNCDKLELSRIKLKKQFTTLLGRVTMIKFQIKSKPNCCKISEAWAKIDYIDLLFEIKPHSFVNTLHKGYSLTRIQHVLNFRWMAKLDYTQISVTKSVYHAKICCISPFFYNALNNEISKEMPPVEQVHFKDSYSVISQA